MPSARNKPPEKTESITLLQSCVANGERQAAGANLLVTPSAATAWLLQAKKSQPKRRPRQSRQWMPRGKCLRLPLRRQ
jgi:hypothetical protein